MRRSVRSIAGSLGLALVVCGAPTIAAGQTLLTVSAGPSEYDLSGTGWSAVWGVHVERSLRPWLGVEAGSGLFSYETQGGTGVTFLLPEVGLRFMTPGRVPLHLTVGAGHTLGLRGDQQEAPVLYGALGLSIDLRHGWMLRPEMRIRVIDPWVGAIGGYTLGVSRRLAG